MTKVLELTGQRFGKLTVVGRNTIKSLSGNTRWDCICDCSKQVTVIGSSLVSGNTSSCGCLQKERATTHGMSNSPEYQSWSTMIRRCTNPDDQAYSDYGRRGITICERWRNSFEAFYQDMGSRPNLYYTLDRRENDKGYYKDNCRWATKQEQANNTRNNVFYEYKGNQYSIQQLIKLPEAKESGVTFKTLDARIRTGGWTIVKAICEPVDSRTSRTYTHNGVTKTISEWSKEYNIEYNKLYRRLITQKWDFEKSTKTL
jgi:hypothetical protein